MDPQRAFAACLEGLHPSLRFATLRSVHYKVDGTWNLIAAKLTFSDSEEPEQHQVHGSMLRISRPLSSAEAKKALDQVRNKEAPAEFGFLSDPKLRQSVEIFWYGPEGFPVRFGEHRRSTGWPEHRFVFRSDAGVNLPSTPLLFPDFPIVTDPWAPVLDWLGEEKPSHGPPWLLVSIPHVGGAITEIKIGPDALKVTAHGPEGFRVRAHLKDGGGGREVVMAPQDGGIFVAPITELPVQTTMFLVDGSHRVLDWAEFWPNEGRPMEGVTIELPMAALEDQIATGEGEQVEFKSDVTTQNRDDVLATVSAFSNGKGGTVFVGVRDDGSIQGLRDAEATMRRIQEWFSTLVEPRPVFHARQVLVQGVPILAIAIEEGSQRPYIVKPTGRGHIRRGASDFPMSRAELVDRPTRKSQW